MSISKHEENMLNLQHQMRQNQSELQSYLAGLDDWTSEIKEKEKTLKTQGASSKNESLPPVRNTIETKKLKKKKKEKKVDPSKPKRISGYDFRAWDKFDVDKALENIDDNDERKEETSSSDYETDEEWEMERKKHLAQLEKDKGNKFLKNGDFERAVEAYSKGIEFDPTNSILPANRALALIKQQKFGAAELDCTTSIVLDPLYVKVYLRRATARAGLGKVDDALSDYRRVLDLEPANKQAKVEMERLEKELLREKEGPVRSSFTEGQQGIVKPVYKSLEDRSKALMKRIVIEEIGVEAASSTQRSAAGQSEIAQKITAKEGQAFDAMFASGGKTDYSSSSDVSHSRKTVSEKAVPSDDNLMAAGLDVNPQQAQLLGNKTELANSKVNSKPSSDEPGSTKSDSEPQPQHKQQQQHSDISQKPLSCPPGTGVTETSQRSTHGVGGDGSGSQVPHSSYQFQADFKQLKRNSQAFLQYFQAIPPFQYPKLFGQCLDADILMVILKSLTLCGSQSRVDLYDILHHLTLVKRFSMTAMFLSGRDKKVVEDLLQHISASGQHTEGEIEGLRHKYQL